MYRAWPVVPSASYRGQRRQRMVHALAHTSTARITGARSQRKGKKQERDRAVAAPPPQRSCFALATALPRPSMASRSVPGVAAAGEAPPLWLPTPGSLLASRLRLAQASLALVALAVLSASNTKAGGSVFAKYLLPAAWLVAVTAVELLVLRRRAKHRRRLWILIALTALDSVTLAPTYLGGSADLGVAVFVAVDNCFEGPDRCAAIRGELPRAALAWIALHGPAWLVLIAHILQWGYAAY